ncbi:holin family protein [Fusobacterium pseudoperiodonticum]|jgi:toxin secretion/phage lysis holin|uniref:phage holin family protein n=1 Tax=Fusobacterium pseudoperiodonticum TaxID=2663009 RepID=UPI00207058CF|nr:phage holin family protein [Fusobacterium pseudoperiodonticum]DAT04873.1 MAG TPA: holin [Caudoviricetes sp.]
MGKFDGLFEHWFIRSIIGFILYLLGGWDKSLEIMMTFIIIDYISGYLKSIYKKEISSKKAFKGIIKKTSCILAVIIGASLDKLVEGTPINVPIAVLNVPLSFKELIIFSIIGNEGISIIENLGEMNFPFPSFIKKFFKQLQQHDEENKDSK